METIEGINFSVTPEKVTFFDACMSKDADGQWVYDEKTNDILSPELVAKHRKDFIDRLTWSVKNHDGDSFCFNIGCNPIAALVLYKEGIITNEMLTKIEVCEPYGFRILGTNDDGTIKKEDMPVNQNNIPVYLFKKQIEFDGKFYTASIMIQKISYPWHATVYAFNQQSV